MSKKQDNNTKNHGSQKNKNQQKQEQQKQQPLPRTPERKVSQQLNGQIFNSLSPFQLPPKINVMFTAASHGNYAFSHDMKVIETPYPHHPNAFRPIDMEDMNQDLRQITGKIDWGNTPVKSNYQSSDESEQSENPSSSEVINQQNEIKQNPDEKSVESQSENPQKYIPTQRQKQYNIKSQRQIHFKKRLTNNKKLLEQFTVPEPNSLGKKVFCNCKKTKCLKLYCDCFRINQTCDGCNCQGCHNLQEYADQRSNAILALMDRNPDPFSQKIHQDKHLKGCNCKKSFCLKKYCQCYQAHLKCGQNCKCDQCKNGGGSQKRQRDRLQRQGLIAIERQIQAI